MALQIEKENKKIENGLVEVRRCGQVVRLVFTTTAGMHSATTTHSLQS